ncbi:MAG: amidohydrolase family protein, partial [Chloroflexi bacterium]|nr:amidohydrolase family protein [Chloroflexota bacterium]
DFASAMLPGLLAERMDDMGIDFAVLYPTRCLGANSIQEPELRQAMCRAYNKMAADVFAPYKTRMTPAAMIPCYSPEEAIAELEYARGTLGLKACSFKGSLQRPIPAYAKDGDGGRVPYYIDALGLDNPTSYDPLWQKCIDTHTAVTVHQGSNGWTPRMAISNGEFNRLGHAADSHVPMAKAMFLGGVVRRFPDLTVSFLEGGVAFGVELLCNIIGGWEKRRYSAMETNLKPTNIDEGKLRELMGKYGYGPLKAKLDETMASLQLKDLAERETECLDDYGEVGASSKREVAELFSKNFYFGCEADDPGNAWAFDPRMPARLKAMLGSDIGHWDVTNYMDVLPEVWEGVEDGLLTEQDVKDLCFTNPMELHTRMNPDFFEGTVVQDAVARAQPALAGAR